MILLPAISGFNSYVNGVAERLVSSGYVTFVIDYYIAEGRAPDTSNPQAIGIAVANLSDTAVVGGIGTAIDLLANDARVDADHIGTVGLCIGGSFAILAGAADDRLKAAVVYYGGLRYDDITDNKPVAPLDRAGDLRCPLIAHYGTFDRLVSAEDVATLEGNLQKAARPYELYLYRGAPHAFDEDHRAVVYRPAASALAWTRSLAFLNWHLRGQAGR